MSLLRTFLVQLKNNNPWLLLLWNEKHRLQGIFHLKKWNDEQAINCLYKNFAGKLPNLKNPTTFSEKQQWLKLHDHNPLMTVCADKYEVRNYIKQKGYAHILNEVYTVFYTVQNFNVNTLPKKFVAKATHGSGWNLVCENKETINWFVWKRIFNSWLHNNIFWPGREWPYKNMKAGIIIEKFLKDDSGQLTDYKFFCFNGQPKFVQANKGRGTSIHAQNFYDLNWQLLPFGKDLAPMPEIEIVKPYCFNEMLKIAKDVAEPFLFVRVDFYEVNKKVVFGEMTFYPKSGLPDFKPAHYDSIVGEMLKLPVA